jgi:outer membrane protein OmpA-like peptidoglycan-associated protein
MKLLTKFPDVNLEIQSHTDDTRDEENNINLSQARAQSVVDYLIRKGIEANRLHAIGFGGKKPIADNKKKAGRAMNRRVELVPYYQDP